MLFYSARCCHGDAQPLHIKCLECFAIVTGAENKENSVPVENETARKKYGVQKESFRENGSTMVSS